MLKEIIQSIRQQLRLEEKAQRQKWEAEKDITKLKKEGIVLHPIEISKISFQSGNYPVLHFKIAPHQNLNLFDAGVPVTLFDAETNENISGGIKVSTETSGEIVIYAEEIPEWLEEKNVGLRLQADERSFKVMHGLLNSLDKGEHKNLQNILSVIYGLKEQQESGEIERDFQYKQLNDSQSQAIHSVINTNQSVHIIHGPPGTGKTTTLVGLVNELIKNDKKIIITAPSNAAVDHFCLQLAKNDLPFVRFGNTLKTKQKVWQFTIEGILDKPENKKQLKRLTIEAEQKRKSAQQFKRKFGATERAERKQLWQEFYNLKKEIRKEEDYIIDKELQKTNIVLGTPVGLQDDRIKYDNFDISIVDEAAQCLAPMAFLVMKNAPVTVLAGDPFQLPPTVISEEAQQLGLDISILETAFKNEIDGLFLDSQDRIPPQIANFSSAYFYENKLDSFKEDQNDFQHIVFYDTAGADYKEVVSENAGISNPKELDFIAEHILPQLDSEKQEIVFISPYAEQVGFAKQRLNSIFCSTIDAIQGQEAEIIILSLVRSNEEGKIGFLKDYRRMNVAITRAKKQIHIVGDSSTLGNDDFYEKLLSYIENISNYKSIFEYNTY